MVLCPFSQKELLEETINHFMECTIPPYSVKKSVGYTFIPDDKIDYEEIIKQQIRHCTQQNKRKLCRIFFHFLISKTFVI